MVMSQTLEIIRRFNIVLQLQLQSYNTGHCMVEADNVLISDLKNFKHVFFVLAVLSN
jgi:hypothetical protein